MEREEALEIIRDELQANPDTASINDLQINAAYSNYKSKFDASAETPDFFEGVFWYYTIMNKVKDGPYD